MSISWFWKSIVTTFSVISLNFLISPALAQELVLRCQGIFQNVNNGQLYPFLTDNEFFLNASLVRVYSYNAGQRTFSYESGARFQGNKVAFEDGSGGIVTIDLQSGSVVTEEMLKYSQNMTQINCVRVMN